MASRIDPGVVESDQGVRTTAPKRRASLGDWRVWNGDGVGRLWRPEAANRLRGRLRCDVDRRCHCRRPGKVVDGRRVEVDGRRVEDDDPR